MSCESHFGDWCVFDENVFCQERGGCKSCCKRTPVQEVLQPYTLSEIAT